MEHIHPGYIEIKKSRQNSLQLQITGLFLESTQDEKPIEFWKLMPSTYIIKNSNIRLYRNCTRFLEIIEQIITYPLAFHESRPLSEGLGVFCSKFEESFPFDLNNNRLEWYAERIFTFLERYWYYYKFREELSPKPLYPISIKIKKGVKVQGFILSVSDSYAKVMYKMKNKTYIDTVYWSERKIEAPSMRLLEGKNLLAREIPKNWWSPDTMK